MSTNEIAEGQRLALYWAPAARESPGRLDSRRHPE
jgi:hypothetical protein